MDQSDRLSAELLELWGWKLDEGQTWAVIHHVWAFPVNVTIHKLRVLCHTKPTVKMANKADKIEKIIARLQARIEEGQYYEAQQQTRVVAARYTKAANWPAAIDIIYGVSQSLLKAGQGGSGGDLALLLVEIYDKAELKPDAGSKGKLLACLRLFDSEEPTRKKFVEKAVL